MHGGYLRNTRATVGKDYRSAGGSDGLGRRFSGAENSE